METPERNWSEAYWSGVDPDKLGHLHTTQLPCHHPRCDPALTFFHDCSRLPRAGAVPVDSVELSSLPTALLRRIVGHAVQRLREHRPPAPSSCYYLSVLDLRVRVTSTAGPVPIFVCRLWPSVLFSGHRQAEAAEAEVEGMDLWYTKATGQFVCEVPIEQTDSLAVDEEEAEGAQPRSAEPPARLPSRALASPAPEPS